MLAGVGLDELVKGSEDGRVCHEAGDGCDVSALAGGEGLGVEEHVESSEVLQGRVWVVIEESKDVFSGFDLVRFELVEEL